MSELKNDRFLLGTYGPGKSLNNGETATFSSQLYIGPKLNKQLKEVAEGLELTRDYGFLAVIAKPMYWVLEQIFGFVGNWGWTIIIFSVLTKLMFYPLTKTSTESMKKMQELQPKLKALQEKYKDNKEKLNEATMKLYREEKVNPLAGCLPMLLPMPILFALFFVFQSTIEFRGVPFLWLPDLSLKDPYYIIPLLMGASMFLLSWIGQRGMEANAQMKMMTYVLPVVFTVMFAFFPSGLVLYWVVNNLLSIAQQWVITRRIEAGEKG